MTEVDIVIPVIGLVALAGQFEIGFDQSIPLLNQVDEQLNKQGFQVVNSNVVMSDSKTVKKIVDALKPYEFDVLCVCVATWSEDHHLLDLLAFYDKPVILWAFPAVDTGSLCGVQQICCVLTELRKAYFYIYGTPDDPKALKEIGEISRAVALINKLKHVKIATIGGRVKGMTEVAVDEFEVKDKTGVRVVNLDEEELIQEYQKADTEEAARLWGSLKGKVGTITSNEEAGIDAIRYYFAMKSLIRENDLEGLCIKCYPRYMGKICLGYSLLSEEGYVCGCEGDLNSTVAMKMLYELSGRPVHNTDLLYPDLDLNTILFSHCGSGGFSIADRSDNINININLAPVRLADSGVCALFPAMPGKITLVNLVGRKGTYRLSVIVGDAIKCGMEFPGNPLKMEFNRDVLEINKQIAEEGIGHHWMGGYGDYSKELEIFCKLNQIRFIRL